MTFFRCSKILKEAGKQEILQRMLTENSRSQIVFRTDIFRKLTLGVPEYRLSISSTHTFHSHALECHMSQSYCKLVG